MCYQIKGLQLGKYPELSGGLNVITSVLRRGKKEKGKIDRGKEM